MMFLERLDTECGPIVKTFTLCSEQSIHMHSHTYCIKMLKIYAIQLSLFLALSTHHVRFIRYSCVRVYFFYSSFLQFVLRNKCFALGGLALHIEQQRVQFHRHTHTHTHTRARINAYPLLFDNAMSMYDDDGCTYETGMQLERLADVCECVIAVATMQSSGARGFGKHTKKVRQN